MSCSWESCTHLLASWCGHLFQSGVLPAYCDALESLSTRVSHLDDLVRTISRVVVRLHDKQLHDAG